MTPIEHLTTDDHRDDLVDATLRLLQQQLPATLLAYVWPEWHCVRFATADGRSGDIKVMVNWDIAPTESVAAGSDAQ